MAGPRAPESQREMLSLVSARVRDAYVRKPFYVEGALDLVSVCREMAGQGLTSVLVRDGARLGIFTTTDLRDALLREVPPQQIRVRDVARFELVDIDADADLFEALWRMVQHRVHRLLVRDGAEVRGLLGQLDLVSFVANHSHVIALQLDEAETVDALREAAQRIDAMAVWLHADGIRVERIARLVGELNRRLFARLWSLLAPPEVLAGSCLLVMGSEGRGEQILKTDQDNALLLRDGTDVAQLDELAARFNAALADFGYPPCPGGIMLTHRAWRATESEFRETIHRWVYGGDPDGMMHMAIFFDAVAVAGDAALLERVHAYACRLLTGEDRLLSRFAAPADQFEESSGWWARLTSRADEQPLDLKKLGLFPIVHGVRALCLRHDVRAAGTAERVEALVAAGALDASLGRDLSEALHYLMGLRLERQLADRAAGRTPDNSVRPAELSTMERDRVRDALAIAKRFRGVLRQTFRLDQL
ncbi:MAG: putative nucleotidyltransferase substrate binding domain-containing protein [Piscinibacter sp.]|uniref:putative nucleotidyltransferase substrate binding domain-containing protein n=1 Tax=Piscinibacter sp. TaxID=1903157 RepID=UPI003D09C89F